MSALRMPIGQSDFRLLRQEKCYFADKSLFIKDILEDSARVILITRPRRFGKTLNLSMLRYYFAKAVDGNSTAELFDGLAIKNAEKSIRQHQGRYPVIFLTLKDLKRNSYAAIYTTLQFLLMGLYREHRYLLTSEALAVEEKNRYQAFLEGQATETEIIFSLKQLSEYLYRHHQIAPLILIDEYDTPIQSGYTYGYYSEVIELFRGFLGSALKDNSYCFKAVLTGILCVSKESLFSGLNNLRVCSVLQKRYGEYFGFTETEVKTLLVKTGLETKSEVIRSWYNGYQIGPHVIYNPWSLLNCVDNEGQLKPYWLNTSDNALVKDCLYRSGLIYQEVFEALLEGKTVDYLIDEQIVFPNLKKSSEKEEVILSFLLMAGYFKPVSVNDTTRGTRCQLAIPNIEIRGLYANLMEEWLTAGQSWVSIDKFLAALLEGDLPTFETSFRLFLENTVSVHDLSHEPEAFYHGFMTGLTAHLQSHPDYLLKSNRESGYGRYDYLILSRLSGKPTILMEFKRVRFPRSKEVSPDEIDTTLQKTAYEALQQIENKAYDTEAKRQSSPILKIAIAFYGKHFKLIHENEQYPFTEVSL